MRIGLIIELSTPKLRGGWVPEMPCRAYNVKKTVFDTVWGGRWRNGKSVGLDHDKSIFGCPSARLIRIGLIIELSTPKIGGLGT